MRIQVGVFILDKENSAKRKSLLIKNQGYGIIHKL